MRAGSALGLRDVGCRGAHAGGAGREQRVLLHGALLQDGSGTTSCPRSRKHSKLGPRNAARMQASRASLTPAAAPRWGRGPPRAWPGCSEQRADEMPNAAANAPRPAASRRPAHMLAPKTAMPTPMATPAPTRCRRARAPRPGMPRICSGEAPARRDADLVRALSTETSEFHVPMPPPATPRRCRREGRRMPPICCNPRDLVGLAML